MGKISANLHDNNPENLQGVIGPGAEDVDSDELKDDIDDLDNQSDDSEDGLDNEATPRVASFIDMAKRDKLSSQERWQLDLRLGERYSKKVDTAKGGIEGRAIPSQNLTNDDVVLAIASVWHGLCKVGIQWAYGDATMFDACRIRRLKGFWSVNTDKSFIVPVVVGGAEEIQRSQQPHELFSEYQRPYTRPQSGAEQGQETVESRQRAAEKQRADDLEKDAQTRKVATANVMALKKQSENGKGAAQRKGKAMAKPSDKNDATLIDEEVERLKREEMERTRQGYQGGIGHLTLAVARRQDATGSPARIRIHHFDSLNSNPQRHRNAARNIIQNSGYLGDTEPIFLPADQQTMRVAEQTCGNTCGIHVILNAWFVMFSLQHWRLNSNFQADASFYAQAHNIIQSALNGTATFNYIIAFLQSSGYCRPHDYYNWQLSTETHEDQADKPATFELAANRLCRGQSVLMNETILRDIVGKLQLKAPWIPEPQDDDDDSSSSSSYHTADGRQE